MSYDVYLCEIIGKKKLAPGIFDLAVYSPALALLSKPGQFGNIRVEGKTLRRPISICDVDRDKGVLRFVIEVRGEGTNLLCQMHPGQHMDILAPLGNGFSLPETKETALFVGGGIGVPPLLYPAKQYGRDAAVILGFRSAANAILIGDFAAAGCAVQVATDDGTMGHHGFVTDLVRQSLSQRRVDRVYACGPLPMLKAVGALCEEKNVPCQVSLEERMACGVGACLVCACKTIRDSRTIYLHVCKDGPVFDSREVVW